ncbi:hypothetical protein [Mycolicibacterium fluoranthenivorans]|uniref:Uncharacterized protein n=1 Tax=Mycolicibacterium fluoranthenivorans TaxID=258505 RepID=A0A7X5U5U6_9MYCO|nr:hypothetical protein [Mycolicibacterium fluoranthenivorans]MCV7354511.1 hypothetical protein [Mycolicibacterium fluoranthenivorans]NIH98882.1 hypothetical protein [Mycolicibacterium fluoranthenivorans]
MTYYVDIVSGSDANNGLSAGAALQNLYTAMAKSDVGTVMVKGYGYTNPYYRSKGFNGVTQGKNINVIGYDGGTGLPYITTHEVLTYTLSSGQTNTYETTRTSVSEVIDMVAGAPGVRLTKMTSIATVEATVGSWWQNGSTLYVHASDNRNLNTTNASRIWALLNVPNFKNVGDYTTYLQDMILYGGTDVVNVTNSTSAGAVATMVNVETGLSQNAGYNNVSMLGVDSVLVNCETTRSGADGFNYHANAGKIPRAIEINCRATDCGHTSSDQCSTAHDGAQVIRIGGTYRTATASVVADINGTGNSTQSWNIGCLAESPGDGYADWQCGLSGDTSTPAAKMWLHGCEARVASNKTFGAAPYGGSQILSRGGRIERALSPVTAY